ncbi:DUF4010 domain-containing protein [Mesorhizobium sp. GR13]|uniref:DUF4010 domain-containing protein n=1 Tax=Mesorhizobium sp. GR13 TaxID=2562308 RepID=UPI001FEDE18D|nr:DUF4010 domain-containing protein [Mesorhizobium sp. GR13]
MSLRIRIMANARTLSSGAVGSSARMAGGRLTNPLALGTALNLAAFIAIVMLAADLVRRAFGDVGVLVVSAPSGIADVDAVTISMAKLGGSSVSLD